MATWVAGEMADGHCRALENKSTWALGRSRESLVTGLKSTITIPPPSCEYNGRDRHLCLDSRFARYPHLVLPNHTILESSLFQPASPPPLAKTTPKQCKRSTANQATPPVRRRGKRRKQKRAQHKSKEAGMSLAGLGIFSGTIAGKRWEDASSTR